MTPELLFSICTYGVLPAWLLLAAAPRWEWTQRIVHAVWLPFFFAVAYGWAFAANPETPEGASFMSLAGVMAFFTSPHVALAGWIHYIVFDLFIGAWEVRDAHRHGIRHGLVLPCLAATFLAGPLGLLLYLGIRLAAKRVTTLSEVTPS